MNISYIKSRKMVIIFILLINSVFSQENTSNAIHVINLKKYKFSIMMQGYSKTPYGGENRELKVKICDEKFISPELMKEINEKGIENIPPEKLLISMPYVAFETKYDSINFFVAYVPYSEEFNTKICRWNIGVALAKLFDTGFNSNFCDSSSDEYYVDVNGIKRELFTAGCVDDKRCLYYTIIYFDDRLYFLAAYANIPIDKNSPEIKTLDNFFSSFSDKR